MKKKHTTNILNNDVNVSSTTDADNRAGRILIAEDNVIFQNVLARQMELLGLKADIVDNGQQAWLKWQTGKYTLLLTDIHMPILDGVQLVKKIRQQEKRENTYIPIIAIMSNTADGEAEKCLAAGMDDFIVKPMTLENLDKMLEHWLFKQKPRAMPGGGYKFRNSHT